ncbi:hypothetical protein [Gordonia sp. MP11Mi]|uniref:Uncharacterized protein n=1 Tax=Gordonia sp. MP11Mi TaxID=3022769 RepID=A0AA97CRF9_9ACTN
MSYQGPQESFEPFGPQYQPTQQPQHEQPTQQSAPMQPQHQPVVPLSDAKRRRNAAIIWLVGAAFLLLSNSGFFLAFSGDSDDSDAAALGTVMVAGYAQMILVANLIGVVSLTAVVHLSLRLAKKA